MKTLLIATIASIILTGFSTANAATVKDGVIFNGSPSTGSKFGDQAIRILDKYGVQGVKQTIHYDLNNSFTLISYGPSTLVDSDRGTFYFNTRITMKEKGTGKTFRCTIPTSVDAHTGDPEYIIGRACLNK